MTPSNFEKQEVERKLRRRNFHIGFLLLTAMTVIFMFWKLSSLILPVVVGALLAYLFRPIKDRFRIKWLPHELGVLIIFAGVGLALFLGIYKSKQMIPDEKQKLELKVRLKYKANEKYQEIVGSAGQEKRGLISQFVIHEFGPMMGQLNVLLDLTHEEKELFMKYRKGFKGQPAINDRFFEYFLANQEAANAEVARKPSAIEKPDAGAAASGEVHRPESERKGLLELLTIWMLAPLIFIFLSFDSGQMRRYFIGLVPNRYFELSLTVMDMLDNAIGKYLRGTLLECALVALTIEFGLFLLGMPLSVALLIGTIAGLANAIPFLGPLIGLIIALAYSLIAESITPIIPGLNPDDLAIYVIVLIAITHLLDNVVFQPIVLGSAVNLHPLVVIVAIIGGSLMMGIWGMLLAIPTVVILKTGVETLFKELKAYRII